jgi:hypothetical protein
MAMRPYINIPLLAPVRACGDPPALHKRTYALTLAIQVGDRLALWARNDINDGLLSAYLHPVRKCEGGRGDRPLAHSHSVIARRLTGAVAISRHHVQDNATFIASHAADRFVALLLAMTTMMLI